MTVHLVRDVLDEQILDRAGRHAGKVDGIALELVPGEPPRVAWIESGALVLAARLGPRLERWLAAFRRRFAPVASPPFRVPWSRVREVGIDVIVDVDAGESPAFGWERWLRDRFIGRLPGSG